MAKILVVDDRPTNREVLVMLLGCFNHEVLEAADGAEALEIVRTNRPDLAIADIVMPTMDGFEFVRRLRGDPASADIRVIFYTAIYQDQKAHDLARTCGVSHILTKPCDPEVILRAVDTTLGLNASSTPCFCPEEFERQHVNLLTNTLSEKVNELEQQLAELRHSQAELASSLEREKAARAEAETANRVKDEFLAVLSHELRTPLNPILGWSQLLRTSPKIDAATLERGLETIQRNAKLQAELIEDLLDISRIIQGKITLKVRPIDLIPVIGSAIETVRLAAEAKSIYIQTKFDPNAATVAGDPERLQQIIWNLVSNAVKFTPPGGQVEIRLERIEVESSSVGTVVPLCPPQEQPSRGEYLVQSGTTNPPVFSPHPAIPPSPHLSHFCPDALDEFAPTSGTVSSYAQITVKDPGKGIDPDFLPHVFEYFRQADSSTTRTHGGLGLGLAIVRNLVELHGGTVWAESAGEGQGATFKVRLPLMVVQGQKEQEKSQPQQFVDLRGTRILVVDDDADSLELIAFILEQYGAKVTAVGSAFEALSILTHVKPELLVSDIGMPGIDGYMFIRQVRARAIYEGGQIPAIALTAYAGESERQQALAAGFQIHLPKPLDTQQLVMAVSSCLEKKLTTDFTSKSSCLELF